MYGTARRHAHGRWEDALREVQGLRRVEQHAVQVGVPRRLPQRLELRLGCGGFSCEDGDLSRVRRLTLCRRRLGSLQCGLRGL